MSASSTGCWDKPPGAWPSFQNLDYLGQEGRQLEGDAIGDEAAFELAL